MNSETIVMVDGQPTLIPGDEASGNVIYEMSHCPPEKFPTIVRANNPLNREAIVRNNKPIKLYPNDRIELLNQVGLGG